MTKLKFLTLFIIIGFSQLLAQEEKIEYNNQLYLNLIFDPIPPLNGINNLDLGGLDTSRGLSIYYSRKIFNPLFIGLSGKFLNKEFNSLSLIATYSPTFFRFSIPINGGIGFNLYNTDLSDINIFYELSSGIEFIIDESWAYGAKVVYLQELLSDKNSKLLVELGIKYFF